MHESTEIFQRTVTTTCSKKWGKLYRKISSNRIVIIDDEKYFSFNNVNVSGNAYYYGSDKSTTPSTVKYKQKVKYESTILVRLTVSPKRSGKPYIHQSNNAINGDVYYNQCIKSKLIPFIEKHHASDEFLLRPDLARPPLLKRKFELFGVKIRTHSTRTVTVHLIYYKHVQLKIFGVFWHN